MALVDEVVADAASCAYTGQYNEEDDVDVIEFFLDGAHLVVHLTA